MYLRILTVEASDLAKPPEKPVFRWMVHHIKEVFLALLPKKYMLDGSSKLEIACGPTAEKEKYSQMLGVSVYFVEDFDFRLFYAMSPVDRDRFVLKVIHDAIVEIGMRQAWSASQIEQIDDLVADVISRDFSLRIPVTKLSKTYMATKKRVEIYRNLNRVDGEAWSCEIKDKSGHILPTARPMRPKSGRQWQLGFLDK